MNPLRSGVVYGVGAYAMWGLFPLYWPLVDQASAFEILAHRMVWTLLVVVVLLTVLRRWRAVRALPARAVGLLAVAAVVISVNWGMFIWAVNNGHVVETSLGYFINPLVTVLVAVVVLRERLRRLQWVAIGLAGTAVLILTVNYGRPPWISLVLAASFATYGLVKKKADVGAIESLAVETTIVLLPAAGYLIWLEANASGTFGHQGLGVDALLVGAGVVTAMPLLCFGAAATRIPLATLGLLQYLTPIMQFALGVWVFHEAVPPVRWLGFALVWLALIVFTAESFRHRRRALRLSADASAV